MSQSDNRGHCMSQSDIEDIAYNSLLFFSRMPSIGKTESKL